MPRDPDLAGQRDPPADRRTTRDPDLRDDDRMRPDPHVVRDVDQVVDLDAVPDLRLADRTAVDRRVRPDLHVRADSAAADLRHLPMRAVREDVAEAVHAHTHARMQDAPRPDAHARIERHVGMEHHILGDVAILAHDDVCADPRPRADPSTAADHRVRPHGDILAELGLLVDDCRRMDPRLDRPLGVHAAQHRGQRAMDVADDDPHTPISDPVVQLFRNQDRTGPRLLNVRGVPRMRKKRQLRRLRTFEGRHPGQLRVGAPSHRASHQCGDLRCLHRTTTSLTPGLSYRLGKVSYREAVARRRART